MRSTVFSSSFFSANLYGWQLSTGYCMCKFFGFFLMCIHITAIDTEYFELQSITLPMPLPPITITSKKKKTHVQRTHRVWHEVPQNADRCLQKDVQQKKEKKKKKKKKRSTVHNNRPFLCSFSFAHCVCRFLLHTLLDRYKLNHATFAHLSVMHQLKKSTKIHKLGHETWNFVHNLVFLSLLSMYVNRQMRFLTRPTIFLTHYRFIWRSESE